MMTTDYTGTKEVNKTDITLRNRPIKAKMLFKGNEDLFLSNFEKFKNDNNIVEIDSQHMLNMMSYILDNVEHLYESWDSDIQVTLYENDEDYLSFSINIEVSHYDFRYRGEDDSWYCDGETFYLDSIQSELHDNMKDLSKYANKYVPNLSFDDSDEISNGKMSSIFTYLFSIKK